MNDQTNKRLRDVLNIAPDGRRVHRWIGRNWDADIAALADAIAGAIEIYNHDGTLVRLDDDGTLIPIYLVSLGALIGEHICGVRVMVHDGVARKDYFTYEFGPAAPAPQATWATGPQRGEIRTAGPDDKVLRQLYLEELYKRIPRVEVSAADVDVEIIQRLAR